MFFVVSKILVWFIYPLSISFFLVLTALILSYRGKKRLYNSFLFSGIVIIYLFSIRPTAELLLSPLEHKYLENKIDITKTDAIVVLSGGEGKRIIKGIVLYHKKIAPLVIMSGGSSSIFYKRPKGALAMKEIATALGVPDGTIIAETESRNTRENAIYTKQILDRIDAKKIVLVTSAFHIPRAYALFKKIGVDAVPVASDFIIKPSPYDPFSFIPNVGDLENSSLAIKEYFGIAAYWIKGWI
ncbi:MAG: YdcF family protein [Candidatus Scalindua sp. AMX11]|nr:MAG: YdcF family protein [Candidatus Scalindua sp.]RZV68734.1 MAG: YdcF family protein [Candidatus Scalindua sp. SCAELEC01]TDE63839.1 MAG: YdcF family protein [Candidatus Scalindua sp. AMX11]